MKKFWFWSPVCKNTCMIRIRLNVENWSEKRNYNPNKNLQQLDRLSYVSALFFSRSSALFCMKRKHNFLRWHRPYHKGQLGYQWLKTIYFKFRYISKWKQWCDTKTNGTSYLILLQNSTNTFALQKYHYHFHTILEWKHLVIN